MQSQQCIKKGVVMRTLRKRQGSRSKQSQYGNKTMGRRQNNVVREEVSFQNGREGGEINIYLAPC